MSDIADRMRTCAAYLLTTQLMRDYDAVKDAADLLIEASNALEAAPMPLFEQMALADPKSPPDLPPPPSQGTWVAPGDALPTWPRTPRPRNEWACPKCDSRTIKGVVRHGNSLNVVCPVCSHQWPYKAKETP